MGVILESSALILTPMGSLATTHKESNSDMGLFEVFLGWEAYDELLWFN
jgi:hypothetical protein